MIFIQPQISGNLDGNWKYYGEVRFVAPFFQGPNSFAQANSSIAGAFFPDNRDAVETQIRSAYFYGDAIGAKWYFGRMEDNLPFTNTAGKGGLVTDSRMDGIRAAFKSGSFKGDIFAGADINGVQTQYTAQNYAVNPQPINNAQAFITGIDMGYNFGPANASVGYYQGWGQTSYTADNPFSNLVAPAQFIEIGADYQIMPLVQVTAFAATNVNAHAVYGQNSAPSIGAQQNLSWLGRLDFGTYDKATQGSMNVYGMYAVTGANSVWTSPNYDVSTLSWRANQGQHDVNGISYFGMNGNAQGFEAGLDWAPAKNMDWHLSYSATTAIDGVLASAQAATTGQVILAPMNQTRQIFKSEFTVFF